MNNVSLTKLNRIVKFRICIIFYIKLLPRPLKLITLFVLILNIHIIIKHATLFVAEETKQ